MKIFIGLTRHTTYLWWLWVSEYEGETCKDTFGNWEMQSVYKMLVGRREGHRHRLFLCFAYCCVCIFTVSVPSHITWYLVGIRVYRWANLFISWPSSGKITNIFSKRVIYLWFYRYIQQKHNIFVILQVYTWRWSTKTETHSVFNLI
jgi:hypothetical protein